ncbi:Fe-S cluster assembly transcriptional regulator IscR [Methylomicrobium album]|uniref:Iron-sulfur cluster assembly transcription factor IscR n=1 Tax=Methylomicrobium album BG8 TaxID=686340 RepID=H8GPE8_METAL|nr:Fe-S cluster assembly transcriptional regulator IscR [Methylomicrobium album]EIC30894.1 iron-sulfur cluster assembly transcription factor IscR [Methylomicrobium album BG8]
MRLTTKGRYAVTAMLDLAFHSQKAPVTLTDIATRQTISLSYLEQLFARLRRAGMVKGVRGPGGGYTLASKANTINIADIIAAVDEQIDTTKCGGEGNCQNHKACLTHDLWMGLSEQIRGYLKGITLADLLEKHQVQEIARRQEQDAQRVIELHLQTGISAYPK